MIAMPDRISLSPQHGGVARLRRRLGALEEAQNPGKSLLPFGIPSLDAALGGGLVTGALHEIAAARETEIPAATGFTLALAARTEGPLVWIAEDMAIWESGAPYGPGLFALGLAPERLIAVAAAKSRDDYARRAVAVYTEGARTLARQNLDVVTQTYELGRATVFDVLNEQRRYLDLERAYTAALREAYEARTALRRALGDVR